MSIRPELSFLLDSLMMRAKKSKKEKKKLHRSKISSKKYRKYIRKRHMSHVSLRQGKINENENIVYDQNSYLELGACDDTKCVEGDRTVPSAEGSTENLCSHNEVVNETVSNIYVPVSSQKHLHNPLTDNVRVWQVDNHLICNDDYQCNKRKSLNRSTFQALIVTLLPILFMHHIINYMYTNFQITVTSSKTVKLFISSMKNVTTFIGKILLMYSCLSELYNENILKFFLVAHTHSCLQKVFCCMCYGRIQLNHSSRQFEIYFLCWRDTYS